MDPSVLYSDSVIQKQQHLKQLNRIAKKPPQDIEFCDLVYSIPDSHIKGGWRQLLKSINGKFRSGELTAIMGPSGAGKSTLLNILAGYVTAGVKGSIKVNGKPRDMKLFNKLSSYIMQEDLVQPRLTVREAMTVAASLKLGSNIGHSEKMAVVNEVIQLLGLEKCFDTKTEELSGGQRRRLSVALELVNNPPVIFLDEPTTGLDNVAIKQCIELLQKISRLGRTVICTIHQPPASLFQNFDQVYVMADGFSVFNGSPGQLVPFLSLANCICPSTSTPADYIIEIVHSHPSNINILQSQIQNGKLNFKDKSLVIPDPIEQYDMLEIYQDTTQTIGISFQDVEYPIPFWTQLSILISRMVIQTKRNKSMLYIQFFHHIISGLLIGGIFFGTGNDAAQIAANFKYCIAVNVFFMYTYVMTPVILFPLEVKLLRREYFNRWFSLKPYFLAVTIVNIPILIFCGFLFVIIVFTLSGQPLEWDRFIWFLLVGINVGLASQGLGFTIGASFDILNGSVVAPHILAVVLALGVYGMGYKDHIESFMKVVISLSYVRFGMVGIAGSLFNNRPNIPCNAEYCHYHNSEVLMEDMGMSNTRPIDQFGYIMIYTVIFRILAYLALKYRMTSELRNKIVYYATKIVKQKE